MKAPFIIDAHTHLGTAGVLVSPEQSVAHLLAYMDRMAIHTAICSDHRAALHGFDTGLQRMEKAFAESGGRIRCLAVFDPRTGGECVRRILAVVGWEGLAGIKIHPTSHVTAADDSSYEPVWTLAAERDLAILAHTWSVSDHNPSQALAIPHRFERWINAYPSVRLVLGHAGGRATGRHEAIRLTNTYPNVYLDFAGDIYCYRLIESLAEAVPGDRILFGSDYPWTGVSDHLTRVLLAEVADDLKHGILNRNAARVYKVRMEC